LEIPEDIDFGNLPPEDIKHWKLFDVGFVGVKFEGMIKSSFGGSGGVKWTGITGSATKDKLVATEWLILVMEGGKVSTLGSWEQQETVNHLAKLTGAPVKGTLIDRPTAGDNSLDATEGSK